MPWGSRMTPPALRYAGRRTGHSATVATSVGGQSCAATLSARVSGHMGRGHALGLANDSAGPALRWPADWPQRDQCHQAWWTELRCDSVCPRERARGAWPALGTRERLPPALRYAGRRTGRSATSTTRRGGQSCAATLSARVSGHMGRGHVLGLANDSAGPALRWPADWPQRGQCYRPSPPRLMHKKRLNRFACEKNHKFELAGFWHAG
jgi:hypothetical protein